MNAKTESPGFKIPARCVLVKNEISFWPKSLALTRVAFPRESYERSFNLKKKKEKNREKMKKKKNKKLLFLLLDQEDQYQVQHIQLILLHHKDFGKVISKKFDS